MADNVQVAVRVRPFNRRELELKTKCCIDMRENQTIIHHPSSALQSKSSKPFAFDHCFWSYDKDDDHFVDQVHVFEALGDGVLDNAFKGYNACIFAYGQTGSGKSYTMMGSPDDKGIIPRLCEMIFHRINEKTSPSLSFKVEVSYMEIYNEKVRDLLEPKTTKHSLKIREHTILGPYVDGLSILAVSSFEKIHSLMEEGNKSRTVAATNMNCESSRSHAVFNIKLTQTLLDVKSGTSGEKVSKMSLVDLAGSERAQKTGAVGARLKEGSNINKSLTTLGLVISALADASNVKPGKQKFIPYRDSVLTWLLKDNLGGNSRTIMVATISPAADNYEESLSTLRYADRAKQIVQHAVVNEDPNAKIIRELREEVEQLRSLLTNKQNVSDLNERLAESERLMADMGRSWEERLQDTEKIHQERQIAMELMGIYSRGISVQQGKFYLVNLNADPSLNELLVYYLKERTLVGTGTATTTQDIQLKGLGIMSQHAIMTVEDRVLYLEPLDGAKTCVNGSVVTSKTLLKHGDRVLWGNNHFFRVNCPGSAATQPADGSTARIIDYDFAREELMLNEMGENNPVAGAVQALEQQHEMDKQAALDKQRAVYEHQIQILRNQMAPSALPFSPAASISSGLSDWAASSGDPAMFGGSVMTNSMIMRHSGGSFPSSKVQTKFVQWAQERDDQFQKSLSKLKETIMKANKLIRDANFMSCEMNRQTTYHVTLQIPAANLTPRKIKTGAFVSEPAILVKRKGKGSQIWSMEKLENKLIDMQDLYEEWKEVPDEEPISETGENGFPSPIAMMDPFYESQENHTLIGVANVFLEVLFHDVKLDYNVPIISQQGEVAGRLHVQIFCVNMVAPEDLSGSNGAIAEEDSSSQQQQPIDTSTHTLASNDSNSDIVDTYHSLYGSQITCRVILKKATGLPTALSNFVFCQYSFWGQSELEVVPPNFDDSGVEAEPQSPAAAGLPGTPSGVTYYFNHSKDFVVTVNDEFLEHVRESALSVEVWGHKSTGFSSNPSRESWDIQNISAMKTRTLQERWAEVTRRVELWSQILELNDNGEYSPVELQQGPDVISGGVYQLKQGQQRRVQVRVRPVVNSGHLPLICQQIVSVSMGSVCTRSKNLQKGLDSYQEEDLNVLRERWSEALTHRREYLDDQIQRLMHKPDKSDQDTEREQALISQWVSLTEERNAVLVPTANSGVPGAPADWNPPSGMERHVPVLFFNLNSDEMTNTASDMDCYPTIGINSILPKEHGGIMCCLPIIKYEDDHLGVVASWDSSIHENIALNRLTPETERVYAILKVVVRISHPMEMELILRKRVCFNVVKRVSYAAKLFKRFVGASCETTSSGVMYEIVSNVPEATAEFESRETLALVAAREEEPDAPNGESYIEKYTKGISAVESILALDRLRQEVSIKEMLSAKKRNPKKSCSLPEGFSSLSGEHAMTRSYHSMTFNNQHDKRASEMMSTSAYGGLAQSAMVNSMIAAASSGGGKSTPLRGTQPPGLMTVPVIAEEQSSNSGDRLSNPLSDEFDAYHADSNNDTSDGDYSTSEGHVITVSDLPPQATSTPIRPMSHSATDGSLSTVSNGSHGNVRSDEIVIDHIGVRGIPDSGSTISSGYGSGSVHVSNEPLEPTQEVTRTEEGTLISTYDLNGNTVAQTQITSSPGDDSYTNNNTGSNRETIIDTNPYISQHQPTTDSTDADNNNVSPTIMGDPGVGVDETKHSIVKVVNNNKSIDDGNNDTNNTMNLLDVTPPSASKNMNDSTFSDYGARLHSLNESQSSCQDDNATSQQPLVNGHVEQSRLPAIPINQDNNSMQSSKPITPSVPTVVAPVTSWVKVGSRATIAGMANVVGTVMFLGETHFGSGIWVGIGLDTPDGRNDGVGKGTRYFTCPPKHGLFLRPDKLTPYEGD